MALTRGIRVNMMMNELIEYMKDDAVEALQAFRKEYKRSDFPRVIGETDDGLAIFLGDSKVLSDTLGTLLVNYRMMRELSEKYPVRFRKVKHKGVTRLVISYGNEV